MSTKTKILYYGDGPQVATGFGTVTISRKAIHTSRIFCR